MLPNYLIIGVQKGATTWLASCLDQHPDVFMADGKELHFFHRHYAKGLPWYESHFDGWSDETAGGEATPGYLFHPEVPDRILATLGDQIKLVASLRHPVDRAYSAFWMFLSRGYMPADDVGPLGSYFSRLLREDRSSMRSRGMYANQVRRYLERFPRENLLFFIYDDIKRDNQKALSDCLAFLGVNPNFVPSVPDSKANKRTDVSAFHHQIWGLRRAMKRLPKAIERPLASAGRRIFDHLPRKRPYEKLSEEIRQELVIDFVDDIKETEELLGRDLSNWYTGGQRASESVDDTHTGA
jgi:hypothetical protein